MLSPEIQTDILSRHFAKKQTVRAIARELGINRKSVARVVDRSSVVLGIQSSKRASRLDDFKPNVLKLIEEDPDTTVMVLLQRIRGLGYDGGYTVLREWVKAQRIRSQPKAEAFFKMTFAVGEAAQVDWGEFQDVFGDGVKIHCFVMVLCYSRLLYIEFTRSEKFEEFIRCHENAIRYFDNCVPIEGWYDNLPTAVSERMGKLTRFNSRFLAYAGHHHLKPYACNLAKGNEKGRVENGVKYIRLNFWHNRKFRDFSDLCAQAAEWRDETANLREHRATRKIPRLVFEHEEKALLQKANLAPYDTDEVFSEEIRPDFHIIYETNQYSVPWTLVGCVATVRIDALEIRVYYQDHLVTRHARCYVKHQRPFTKPEHEQGLKETKPQGKNAHIHWQIETLESYGPPLKQYLECLRHSHRSLRHEVSRLLALGTIYGAGVLSETVESLLKRGTIGTEQIELALRHREKSREGRGDISRPAPMNLQDERLARIPSRIDLRQYDQLILNSLERSGESTPPAILISDSQEKRSHGNPDQSDTPEPPRSASIEGHSTPAQSAREHVDTDPARPDLVAGRPDPAEVEILERPAPGGLAEHEASGTK
jgi:transposase